MGFFRGIAKRDSSAKMAICLISLNPGGLGRFLRLTPWSTRSVRSLAGIVPYLGSRLWCADCISSRQKQRKQESINEGNIGYASSWRGRRTGGAIFPGVSRSGLTIRPRSPQIEEDLQRHTVYRVFAGDQAALYLACGNRSWPKSA